MGHFETELTRFKRRIPPMAMHSLKTLLHRLSADIFFRWIVRRRMAVLIVIAAITLFFLSTIPRLTFNTSVYDMVIEALDETRQYQSFKDIFGSEEIIRVVISCGTSLKRPPSKKSASWPKRWETLRASAGPSVCLT
jgi:hypothetical protein